MTKDIEKNPLVKHSVEFSIAIIKYVQVLEENKKYVIARQLLRSGTSIGACIMESQSAESKADFIHKLKIADKEARETLYWLYLCEQTDAEKYANELTDKLGEVMRLLNAIILSAKKTST